MIQSITSTSRPVFRVGNSALFTKNALSPQEFGREITRLGFSFGLPQLEQYQADAELTAADRDLLRAIQANPGFGQLIYANLVTGAFLCFARRLLRVPSPVLQDVRSGIAEQLKNTLPSFTDNVLENHLYITNNFSLAIEREMAEDGTPWSLTLVLQYLQNFYFDKEVGPEATAPSGLARSIDGLGSRVVAVCQNNMRLSFEP